MTRMSKKGERRGLSPRKRRPPAPKTGSKKDNLQQGFREHGNALEGEMAKAAFIPKIQ